MKPLEKFDRKNLMAYTQSSGLPCDELAAERAFALMDSGCIIWLYDNGKPVSTMYLVSGQGYVEEPVFTDVTVSAKLELP